jgi:hypothetical protein
VKPRRKRGAPLGNRNRYKTGRYSKTNRATRAKVAKLKRGVRATLMLANAVLEARAR